MNSAETPNPFTPPTTGLEALMELFKAELRGVQFPGVDAKVLEDVSERVHAAACELRRCEVALEAARGQLAATREDALQKGQRALAYARVFSQDQPELHSRLQTLELGRSPALGVEATAQVAPPARRRGRPPKGASVTSLFGEQRTEPSMETEPESQGQNTDSPLSAVAGEG